MEMKLLEAVNTVRSNNNLVPFEVLPLPGRLREDLGFSSIDLAELTVRIEDSTGVDVFADGVVRTVEEILSKLGRSSS